MSILSKSDRQYLNSIVSNFNKELGDFFGSNIAMSDLSPQKISEFLVESEKRAETAELKGFVQSLVQSYLKNIKLILDKINNYQEDVTISLSSSREETARSISVLRDQLSKIEGLYSQINHSHSTLYSTLNHDHDGTYALVKHTHQDLQRVIEKVQLELQRLQEDLSSKKDSSLTLPHAKEHVTGSDQIPIATNKTRGLASPIHIRNIEKALLLAEQAMLTAKPLFGGGGSGSGTSNVENLNDIQDVNAPSPSDGQLLKYDSATSKWIAGSSGSDTTELQTFVDGDLVGGVLTVTHSLSSQHLHVTIWDNSNIQIFPDSITATNTSTQTIDLSSYGTLTGTWRVRLSL
jgi:hypothetical protein